MRSIYLEYNIVEVVSDERIIRDTSPALDFIMTAQYKTRIEQIN